MNNTDIAQVLSVERHIPKSSAKAMVDRVFALIVDAAVRGDDVAISGFGKFKVKQTQARSGRNPRTGDPMEIAASKKIAFTPAKAVKDKING